MYHSSQSHPQTLKRVLQHSYSFGLCGKSLACIKKKPQTGGQIHYSVINNAFTICTALLKMVNPCKDQMVLAIFLQAWRTSCIYYNCVPKETCVCAGDQSWNVRTLGSQLQDYLCKIIFVGLDLSGVATCTNRIHTHTYWPYHLVLADTCLECQISGLWMRLCYPPSPYPSHKQEILTMVPRSRPRL